MNEFEARAPDAAARARRMEEYCIFSYMCACVCAFGKELTSVRFVLEANGEQC